VDYINIRVDTCDTWSKIDLSTYPFPAYGGTSPDSGEECGMSRMASTSEASALREIRGIRVRQKISMI
ncbi:MAG: hypothetical protein II293_04905, partial [Bacteroidaceae bacterium]|nr:hypothetical protein [Bacteroidaceae bacterium]